MHTLHTAPALRFTLFFTAGILLQSCCGLSLLTITAMTAFFLFVAIVTRHSFLLNCLSVLCLLACGMLRLSLAEASFQIKEQIPECEGINLNIVVLEQRTSPYTIDSYVVESSLHDRAFKATLYARTDAPVLLPGHSYTLQDVDIQRINKTINPYVFDYYAYAKRKGISHRIRTSSKSGYIHQGTEKPGLYFAHRIRSSISVRFLSVLGVEKGSLVNGFLLGMKNEIPEPLSAMFRQLGISHLLAVSGLHVGLIVLVVFQLLSLFKLPRVARTLILACFLCFYCRLSGAAPSVIRSSLMSVLLLAAPVFHRSYYAMNAVAASAFILLMAKPFYIQEVGFLFSFAAVFGILIAYKSLKNLLHLKTGNKLFRYCYDMLLVSAAASLFTAPFALYYFNTLQLASLLLNIIAIPLTFCVMITAMLSIPFLFLPGIIGNLILNALDLCLELFRMMLRLAAASEIWTMTPSSWWKPLILAFLLFLIVTVCSGKKRIIAVTAAICFISGITFFFLQQKPELIQYSLQRGKAVALRHKREVLLINTGAVAFSGNDYERFIKAMFTQRGVRKCSVIITAADKNKYASLPYILRDFPDSKILVPPGFEGINVKYETVKCDSSFRMGDFNILLLCRNDYLDVLIAGEKDSLCISDRESIGKADIICDNIPPEAIHYLYHKGKWRRKK